MCSRFAIGGISAFLCQVWNRISNRNDLCSYLEDIERLPNIRYNQDFSYDLICAYGLQNMGCDIDYSGFLEKKNLQVKVVRFSSSFYKERKHLYIKPIPDKTFLTEYEKKDS